MRSVSETTRQKQFPSLALLVHFFFVDKHIILLPGTFFLFVFEVIIFQSPFLFHPNRIIFYPLYNDFHVFNDRVCLLATKIYQANCSALQ